MNARSTKTGKRIQKTLDSLLGTSSIDPDSFELGDDGQLQLEYEDDGTDVHWDSGEPYTEHGIPMYIDEDGNNVPQTEIELFDPASPDTEPVRPKIDMANHDRVALEAAARSRRSKGSTSSTKSSNSSRTTSHRASGTRNATK